MKVPSSYPVLDGRPIDQWKVTELKEELKKRKLTTKGLKDDLIKRLDEAIRNENESAKEIADIDIDIDIDSTIQPVVETDYTGTVSAVSKTSEDMIDQGNIRNEVDGGKDEAHLDDITVSLGEAKVQEMEVTGGSRAEVKEGKVASGTELEVQEGEVTNGTQPEVQEGELTDGSKAEVQEGEVTSDPNVEVQEGKVKGDARAEVQKGGVEGGTDSVRDEVMTVQVTTVYESLVTETVVNVQESENHESQNEREDLKSQQENEPPHEDVKLTFSDANNQLPEVSTVLGFQVSSDSISSDCVSINEKIELKDNIIADNVKLELDIKPEMAHPSSTSVLPHGGKLHPVDVEEPHENKVTIEEKDNDKASNVEINKKNNSADVVSSEKLNLDRSSGDDSMEDYTLEGKQIDSNSNSDEVGDRSKKNDVPVAKEEAPLDGMQDDVPADNTEVHVEIKNAPAEATTKRKLHDQEAAGNHETSKRQRRWNSENLKVPEPQNNIASSTTPKEMLSTTSRHNFSRSDSTASEDMPKERVVPPSPKPPTNSLRIDRFLRPFTLKAVQELLAKTGTVNSFWMDQIKTHCYVMYSSVEEAIETRNALYNLQWPPNGGRLLVAEFVDPQEVKMRVEAPPQSPATPVSTGATTTPPAPPTFKPQPSPRQLVPKQQQQQVLPTPSLPPPPPLSSPLPARERITLPPPPPPPEKLDPPIVTLDDLFRKTKATPRIYYLPLSDEQVAAKVKALGKSTRQ